MELWNGSTLWWVIAGTLVALELATGTFYLLMLALGAAAGALAAVAVARKVFVADRGFGKLVYLYVDPEHRRLGLGRELAERAREAFAAEGISRFIVDLAFLPDAFGSSLAGYGYESFGARWIRAAD